MRVKKRGGREGVEKDRQTDRNRRRQRESKWPKASQPHMFEPDLTLAQCRTGGSGSAQREKSLSKASMKQD